MLCVSIWVLRQLPGVCIVRQALNKCKTNLCETPSMLTVETGSARAINGGILQAVAEEKECCKIQQ